MELQSMKPSASEIQSALDYLKSRIKFRPPGSQTQKALETLEQAIQELFARRLRPYQVNEQEQSEQEKENDDV